MSSTSSFQADVRNLSHKGLGVVTHPDGRVFFVRSVWPGEAGTFQIKDNARTYDEAQLVELSTTSPDRVAVPCPHQGVCGGCPWMGISYEAQLRAKEQRVNFLLSKNSIAPKHMNPILGSPLQLGYRNRAQFKTEGERIGYVSEGTNTLAPIQDCVILNGQMRQLLKGLQQTLPNPSWAPVDGFPWSYLDIDDEQSLKDIVPNRRRPFRQGNSLQNMAMKNWIVENLKGTPKDWPVIEAFSGSGNLTESLSQAGFSNIVAAEVRGSAVEELKARAFPGVRIQEIDMNDKNVWRQLAKEQPLTKVLLVDPPREGMESRAGIFEYLPKLEVVVYISCEPTTWARDVKDFQLNGWKVAQLTPLDLFPHTPHVEILSILTKK